LALLVSNLDLVSPRCDGRPNDYALSPSLRMAEEYERIVVDLEKGAIAIIKPEQMPQRQQ